MVRIRAPPIAITPESSPWPATHLRQQHTGRGAPLRTTLAHDGSTGPLTMVSCLHLYTGVSSPVTGLAQVKVVHHSLVIQLLFTPLLPVRWCHNRCVRRLSVRGVRTRGVCRGLRSVHSCFYGRGRSAQVVSLCARAVHHTSRHSPILPPAVPARPAPKPLQARPTLQAGM